MFDLPANFLLIKSGSSTGTFLTERYKVKNLSIMNDLFSPVDDFAKEELITEFERM